MPNADAWAILSVGPGQTYSTVQAAVNAAAAGDTFQIWSATYVRSAGWVYVNGKNNVTFRSVGTPRPILDAGSSCLRAIITCAEEGASNPDQHLYVVNNTIVNNKTSGTFVNNASGTTALLENNIQLVRAQVGVQRAARQQHPVPRGGLPADQLRQRQLRVCLHPRDNPSGRCPRAGAAGVCGTPWA